MQTLDVAEKIKIWRKLQVIFKFYKFELIFIK